MPLRKSLDVWPALPIVISYYSREKVVVDGMDNLIAALERKDRVHEIDLMGVSRSESERFVAEMQEPFPELSSLDLSSWDEEGSPSLPDSFLGGSAPRLREFYLYGIKFPALQEFLLSTSGLVKLSLGNIHYISPEDMVFSLSALTSLRECSLSSPDASRQGRANLPLTRTVLPALTLFDFEGTSEYLGAFVDLIDAPLLHTVKIFFIFPHPLVPVGDSQFRQFIGRTQQFKALNKVNVIFQNDRAVVKLSPALRTGGNTTLQMESSSGDLSSLAQFCSSTLPSLSIIESLDVYEDGRFPESSVVGYAETREVASWPEFLRIFIAVKELRLSKKRALRVAPSLQEFAAGQGATDVLPDLQTLFLEEPRPPRHVQEAIEQFVAARERFGRPVPVGRWERAVDTENG
jgi:hypothetical protein